jgi:hypothetical protein
MHDVELLISFLQLHKIQPLQLLCLQHLTKRCKAAYQSADELYFLFLIYQYSVLSSLMGVHL